MIDRIQNEMAFLRLASKETMIHSVLWLSHGMRPASDRIRASRAISSCAELAEWFDTPDALHHPQESTQESYGLTLASLLTTVAATLAVSRAMVIQKPDAIPHYFPLSLIEWEKIMIAVSDAFVNETSDFSEAQLVDWVLRSIHHVLKTYSEVFQNPLREHKPVSIEYFRLIRRVTDARGIVIPHVK